MLDAIKKGDRKVFEEIYEKYYDPFVKWAGKSFGLSEQDAEELFQNAVLLLYDNVRTGKLTELTSSIKTYLFGIGRNKAHELLRERKRMQLTSEDVLLKYVAEDSGKEDKIVQEEKLRLAYRALNIVGDPCRSVLKFFLLDGMNMDAIATLMGYKNASTVKVKKNKCLKRIKKILEGDKSLLME